VAPAINRVKDHAKLADSPALLTVFERDVDEVSGARPGVLSSFQTVELEVADRNDSVHDSTAILVSNGLPYRRMPKNGNGEAYDPRVGTPNFPTGGR